MKSVFTFLLILLCNTVNTQNQNYLNLLDQYHTEKNFNGIVLVASNGKIEFLSSIGISDRKESTKLNTTSKLKIASLTKVYTAVLIMKLVEERKIDLKGTIGQYMPEYKGEGKNKVTIHNLLTYSSGIENKLDQLGMLPYQKLISLDEFIQTYCSGNLIYIPGEKSVYGNTEYILLHKIIENVSKKSYEEYLKDVILDPYKLNNTGLLFSNIKKDVTPSYIFNDTLNTFTNDLSYFPELYFGSGALYSTAEDLLKLDQALFNNKILKQKSTSQLLTFYPELGYTAYGLWGSNGWGNFKEPFYYRSGGILGSTANWIHTVENGKTIIVLSNTNATNLYELSEKLYLISINEE